jgi:hypothetical protein
MIDDDTLIRRIASAVIEEDQQQMLRCQRGQHDMLATASPGVVVCRLCRTLGVCLWCGMTLPQGACITVCAKHVGAVQWQARHRPLLNRLDPSYHVERSEL